MAAIPNDEPVYEDALGHFPLVSQVGNMLRTCDPPYVLGVCGAWGSGKTSFLRKLWAYQGGPFDVGEARGQDKRQQEQRRKWFEKGYEEPSLRRNAPACHVVWFNPWQHQFEDTPLVALLHEIRRHLSGLPRVRGEAGKLLDVATHSMLNTAHELAKALKLPLLVPSAKGIQERGQAYEAERLDTPLFSQRFRDFFEQALAAVIGPEGRMIIFIDDLDRCEGEVAYRLLEALKLHLNVRNCVYVLGLDQVHLEESIARVLSGGETPRLYRPLAREYLGKMFQSLFLLPVPENTTFFMQRLLEPDIESYQNLLQQRFGLPKQEWQVLLDTLDQNLPHNPRKIKSFLAAWKLHLNLLDVQQPKQPPLDWRLTLILTYLGQFEEPLFRKIEEAPGFYSDEVVRFCRDGSSPHPLFDGLERPYGATAAMAETTGGLEAPPSSAAAPSTSDSTPAAASPVPRVFWISRLVNTLDSQGVFVDAARLRCHLVRTGGALP